MRGFPLARGALVAALLGLVAGCGSAGIARPRAAVDPAGVLRADVSRSTVDAPTGPLVDGLVAFGHDLIAATGASRRNTVVSPLSVALAFSMARAGAGGATAAQIDRVLHFPATGRDAAFDTLTRALVSTDAAPPAPSPSATRRPGARPAPPVVAIANGLFVQSGLQVGQPFLRTLAADYGAAVRTVDFPSGDGAAVIDEWVRRQTAGRIQRLFDSLDPGTRLVLANAVYLKADWAHPFAERPTAPAPFTRADGSRVDVATMHDEATYRYAAGSGWQAVELPYAGGELAMWVLVPSADGDPVDLLAPATLRTVRAGLREAYVAVALPRWDVTSALDLADVLGRLGLRVPFSSGADFGGIAPGLSISQAVHRATITVDEWGTEAAAVTGLAFATAGHEPARIAVTADHPFAYAVVDRASGAPLFLGTVTDPSAP